MPRLQNLAVNALRLGITSIAETWARFGEIFVYGGEEAEAFDDAVGTGRAERRRHPLGNLIAAHHDDAFDPDTASLALETFADLADRHRKALDGVGGFDAKLIDEARTLAKELRAMLPKTPASLPAKRLAIEHRNRLLRLLDARVRRVRRTARYVFRHHPAIAQRVSSAYEESGARRRVARRRGRRRRPSPRHRRRAESLENPLARRARVPQRSPWTPSQHPRPDVKHYRMRRRIDPNGAGLYQVSHFLTELKTGRGLDADFVPPLVVRLDPELPNGVLPTFFESPAWIATRAFHATLLAAGVENVEASPVEMRDEVNDRVIDDYLLLEIVGRVACLNVAKSEARSLGDGMIVVDRLVLDPARVPDLDLFVADEDTDWMIVSERLQRHLAAAGYGDICFEALD